MAYTRRDIRGGAVQTTLNGGITSGATSCVITASTGWPDGGTNPAFYVVIDPGLTTEEKILCSTRSGTTVNFAGRGSTYGDGTSAAAHSSGAVIYPCVTAVDLDEANLAVSKLIGLATAVGQVPVVDAANSFAMVQAKTSGQILVGNGTTVASVAVSGDATLASTGAVTIAAGAVTSAKILDGTIATGDMAANAVTNAVLAGMTRGTIKAGNSSGAASDFALGTASQFLATDGTDPVWRTMSGDATLSAGAIAIGSGKVTNTMLAGSIATSKLAQGGFPVFVDFSRLGTLTTGTGTARWRAPIAMTVQHVRLAVGTAPTGTTSTPISGQSLVVDVNKNGTTLFTTQANRPTIAASANAETATTAPDVTALAAGDYLTVDIDFVGSTVAGADLVVVVYLLA